MAIQRIYNPPASSHGDDAASDFEPSAESGNRKEEGLETDKGMVRVYDIVNAGPRNRFTVSNILVHNCQFSMSWKKFQASCKSYGRDLDDKICQLAVFKYRKKRDQIVRAWRGYQDMTLVALNTPGEVFWWKRVNFCYGSMGGFPALKVTLPSGHCLIYPDPAIQRRDIEADIIEECPDTGELHVVQKKFTVDQITFYGQKPGSSLWGRVETGGPKIYENSVQATAGDFLTHGLLQVEKEGFRPFATIHDQVLAPFEWSPAPRGKIMTPDKAVDLFKTALCSLPPWAPDFPLEAKVNITPFYAKD